VIRERASKVVSITFSKLYYACAVDIDMVGPLIDVVGVETRVE